MTKLEATCAVLVMMMMMVVSRDEMRDGSGLSGIYIYFHFVLSK
jgi:hypothetical protein